MEATILLALGTILVAALIIGYLGNVYNQLVGLEERVEQADKNIDVLLKQRQDELSKLIDAVKESMSHEEELLTNLTEAREQAERASTPSEKAEADQQVRDVMAGFRARVEEYPDLKSQTNLLRFQERISDIETQISDRREFYNESVTRYNTKLKQYPYVIIGKRLGYEEKEYFTAEDDELQDVDVGAAFN